MLGKCSCRRHFMFFQLMKINRLKIRTYVFRRSLLALMTSCKCTMFLRTDLFDDDLRQKNLKLWQSSEYVLPPTWACLSILFIILYDSTEWLRPDSSSTKSVVNASDFHSNSLCHWMCQLAAVGCHSVQMLARNSSLAVSFSPLFITGSLIWFWPYITLFYILQMDLKHSVPHHADIYARGHHIEPKILSFWPSLSMFC